MDFVIDELPDGAVFRLNRPEKLNSSTPAIWHGLEALIDRLEQGAGRFLVVTGTGEKAFCAGTDLGGMVDLAVEEMCERCDLARGLLTRLSRSSLISVAALNGLAYGGGLEFAAACTFRVAMPHVRLSVPEVKIGAIPAYGGTQFLPALLGPAVALDLLLTGRAVPASEALAMGLISRVCDEGADVTAEAVALARSVTQFSAVAIAALRQAVEASGPQVSDRGMARERALAFEVFSGADAREGTAAFLEKRVPVFVHR